MFQSWLLCAIVGQCLIMLVCVLTSYLSKKTFPRWRIDDRILKMLFWSSTLKWRISMALRSLWKSSLSFLPMISQFPPCPQKKQICICVHSSKKWIMRLKLSCRTFYQITCDILDWGNSRFLPLEDRKIVFAVMEAQRVTHKKCDNFFHLWPEIQINITYVSI